MSKRSVLSRKAFHVTIDFDVHAVTCPGVWLCPKGMIMLRITMLGVREQTKRVEPILPLLFHERFHFRKLFPEVGSLSELTEALKKMDTHIELIQVQENKCRGKLLASFKRSMAEVLNPSPADKGLVAGVDVDLLMESTDCFPGILAPKVEVSTRVMIEEMINYPVYESWVVNPMTVSSCKSPEDKCTKDTTIKEQKPQIRQKRVCHRKRKPKCVCCKPKSDVCIKTKEKLKPQEPEIVQEGIIKAKGDHENKCYCCQRCGKELDVSNHGEVIRKDEFVKEKNKYDNFSSNHTPQHAKYSCDCHLCYKYNHVFSCSCDSAKDNSPSDLASLKGYPCSPFPVLPRKKVNSWCCGTGKPLSCSQLRSKSPTKVRHCFCKEPVNCCCKAYTMKKHTNPWCG